MNTPTISTNTALPNAAVELIEAFSTANPNANVRVWTRIDDRWVQIGAEETDPAPAGPTAGNVLRVISPERVGTIELEVDGDGIREADKDLLATSLTKILAYEHETRAAARELSERYEEINLLYSISEVLGSVISLRKAAYRILTEVADVLAARRASLWVLDTKTQHLNLAAAVGEDGLAGPIPVDDLHSVTARVFRDRQTLNVERGKPMPPGSGRDPRPLGREAFLSVPINFTPRGGEGRTIGVITLIGRRTDVRFNAGDERLLSAIASQVGAALETHRLMAESVRRERVEHELELAHDLQLKLLPEPSHFGGKANVAARCVPAESVGGDFYHLFRLSDERLGIVIGDVSGHGFAAAMIMAMTMSAVAIYAQEAESPADVLYRVHAALSEELENTEMHLSLFYGVLDPARGHLLYANAGHPHAFRIDDDGEPHRLGALNPPVGTVPVDAFAEAETPWDAENDRLLLFTDGLSDAFADETGRDGEERLLQETVRLRGRPPADVLDRIFQSAAKAEPVVPPDDRTAVLLKP